MPAEAFEQEALAMSAIITNLSLIDPREEVNIICEEPGRIRNYYLQTG
jgi:SHS2 domain-containing protein